MDEFSKEEPILFRETCEREREQESDYTAKSTKSSMHAMLANKRSIPDIHVAKVLKFANQLPFSQAVDYACKLQEAALKKSFK